ALLEADARRRGQHEHEGRVAGGRPAGGGEQAQVVAHPHRGGSDEMGAGALDRAAPRRVPLEAAPDPVRVEDLGVDRERPRRADPEPEGDRLTLDDLVPIDRPLDHDATRADRGRHQAAQDQDQEAEREGKERDRSEQGRDEEQREPERAGREPPFHRAGTSSRASSTIVACASAGAPATVWIRWARTGPASDWTSSGTTKPRPCSAAWARAAASSIRPPRGLAPASLSG